MRSKSIYAIKGNAGFKNVPPASFSMGVFLLELILTREVSLTILLP